MEGSPYCSHCGTTFRWTDDENENIKKYSISDEDIITLLEVMEEEHEGLSKSEVFKIKKDIQQLETIIPLLKCGNLLSAHEHCEIIANIYYEPPNIIERKLLSNLIYDILHFEERSTYALDYAEHLLIDAKKALYGENYVMNIINESESDDNDSLENMLDAKMENLKKLYSRIDKNVSIKSSVKFKLCENCGKKVNKVAEKCPYCNGTNFSDDLSKYECNLKFEEENVKFCPSCHNRYYDSNFCTNCGEKLISKSEYGTIFKRQKQQEEKELKEQKLCPICLKEGNPEDKFCMFCGEKLISKWEYEYLKKRWGLRDKQEFSQRYGSIKKSTKQQASKNKFGIKNCPVCNQEIPKNAVRCVYCKTIQNNDFNAGNNIKSNEFLDDWYVCLKCGKKYNQVAFEIRHKCSNCGGTSFKTFAEFQKEQPIKSKENFDYCKNCNTYIPNDCEYCPYCESTNIKRRIPKPDTNNYKSRLKVKETSNKGLDYCNNCYTYIPKGNSYCPHCGSTYIERKGFNLDAYNYD